MPANSLICKSIWQGTINSCPTVGVAGGGVPSTQGGRRVPAHTLLRPTNRLHAQDPDRTFPLPMRGYPSPPQVHNPQKRLYRGKKYTNPQYCAAQDTGPCPSRAARQHWQPGSCGQEQKRSVYEEIESGEGMGTCLPLRGDPAQRKGWTHPPPQTAFSSQLLQKRSFPGTVREQIPKERRCSPPWEGAAPPIPTEPNTPPSGVTSSPASFSSPYPRSTPFASPGGTERDPPSETQTPSVHYSSLGFFFFLQPPRDKRWLGDTGAPGAALACRRMAPGLGISAEPPEGGWKAAAGAVPWSPAPACRSSRFGAATPAQGRGHPPSSQQGVWVVWG